MFTGQQSSGTVFTNPLVSQSNADYLQTKKMEFSTDTGGNDPIYSLPRLLSSKNTAANRRERLDVSGFNAILTLINDSLYS
jgi:hypothetical protein